MNCNISIYIRKTQMLRRTKDDVDIHLPSLKEIIVKIKLS